MVKYSDEVFAYVPKPMKRRLRAIKKIDRRYSESYIIGKCLEQCIEQFEREVGIRGPAHKPHDRHAVA